MVSELPSTGFQLIHGWIWCEQIQGVRDLSMHKSLEPTCKGPHQMIYVLKESES